MLAEDDADADDDTARLQKIYKSYKPLEGYFIVEAPSPSQRHDKKWWRGKRLAHIWETGWDLGMYKRKCRGEYVFLYLSNNVEYGHLLDLSDYGADKVWVAVARTPRVSTA